jgi:MFS family permease
MKLTPRDSLSEEEVDKGLKLVIAEGLTTEVMTSFTGGAFLVAMALLLGASNVEIGLLAAMPSFTNLFQLISIFLVRKFNNRRAIVVICSLFARIPLLIIGSIAFFSGSNASVRFLIFFLFFYYLFGSIAGPTWNAWMKDLVPEKSLGSYFARRSSYTQMTNVVISLLLAFVVDFIKKHYVGLELETYALMFIAGGIFGITGSFLLANVPEPRSEMKEENILSLFKRPLKDQNFRRLLQFNSAWVFALNMATPFFTVFMLQSLRLPLSYIIGLSIVTQVFSILTIRSWGAFADRYSNKTIIAIAAPLYIMCLIAWCFVGMYKSQFTNLGLLLMIHMVSGVATAGINLSVTNIGLKLSPAKHAIVYLSTKNIITSFFASMAPLLGGRLADYFMDRSLEINATWTSQGAERILHIVSLHEWNFLFLFGAALGLIALELLVHVTETGEVHKEHVMRVMRATIRIHARDFFVIESLIGIHNHLWQILKRFIPFVPLRRRDSRNG